MLKNKMLSRFLSVFLIASTMPSQVISSTGNPILERGENNKGKPEKNRNRNHVSKKPPREKSSPATKCFTKKKTEESMQLLFDAFLAVDDGFNTVGGLNAEQIIQLGYFGPLTSTIALGPFTPDVCGHTDHTNQPGAFQAIGEVESAFVQIAFEGGLLEDPNFPYKKLSKAPKLFHQFPIVTACLGNDLVNVTAIADVRYPGVDGPLVARVTSLAQYRLRTDEHGNTIIPQIVWIQFFISYFDC